MQEHEGWLRIAKEDLLMAKLGLANELFSHVTYNCQQCAEKALKGYLVFKRYPAIIKTHDLLKLLELCMSFDQEFQKKFDAADYINPFSTKFRYPTEYDLPDFAEAELAIKHARSIFKFVLKKISEPETGQTQIF